MRLVVGDGTSATLEPHLASGSLDAAVVNLPQSNPDLVERPLFDEDLVLVVPSDHPLAEQQAGLAHGAGRLRAAPARARDGLPGRDRRAPAGSAGVTLQPRAELDGVRLIASLTLQGYGPAILPATRRRSTGSAASARVSVSGLPRRRVGVVLRRRGRPSAPARAMLEIARDSGDRQPGSPARGVHCHPSSLIRHRRSWRST